MSYYVAAVPDVIIKQGKMIKTTNLKALVVCLALLLYLYLMLFIKSFYLRSKRLDHIFEMAMDTEKKMLNVHNMDENLAKQISAIDELYEDY